MKITRFLASASALLAASMFSSMASAHWTLDNDGSTLSFVTVKAEHVAEVHTFDELSGDIGEDGSVHINIEFRSVNTLIPIRNERMQAMLFESNLYPRATINADIDIEEIAEMSPGSSESIQLNFSLNMREASRSYTAEVLVTRLEGGILASTLKPVIVNAEEFDLVTGVEALREVAGLPSISRAVPVSFTVLFTQEHAH